MNIGGKHLDLAKKLRARLEEYLGDQKAGISAAIIKATFFFIRRSSFGSIARIVRRVGVRICLHIYSIVFPLKSQLINI